MTEHEARQAAVVRPVSPGGTRRHEAERGGALATAGLSPGPG